MTQLAEWIPVSTTLDFRFAVRIGFRRGRQKNIVIKILSRKFVLLRKNTEENYQAVAFIQDEFLCINSLMPRLLMYFKANLPHSARLYCGNEAALIPRYKFWKLKNQPLHKLAFEYMSLIYNIIVVIMLMYTPSKLVGWFIYLFHFNFL